MTTEYYYWEDNKVIKKDGLVEIRKTFIKRNGKNSTAYIFKDGRSVGRICYWKGWYYEDLKKVKLYEINENGTVKR